MPRLRPGRYKKERPRRVRGREIYDRSIARDEIQVKLNNRMVIIRMDCGA
jgi:hypothetical protein